MTFGNPHYYRGPRSGGVSSGIIKFVQGSADFMILVLGDLVELKRHVTIKKLEQKFDDSIGSLSEAPFE